MYKDLSILSLKGKVITDIKLKEDEIMFVCESGEVYNMYHMQNCCESVSIEEIHGNLDNLLNSEIVMAECVEQEGETDWGTNTWTFYKLATVKGYVTIRWYGESNGYYSESVNFERIK